MNRNTAIIAINKRNVIEGIKFSKKKQIKRINYDIRTQFFLAGENQHKI